MARAGFEHAFDRLDFACSSDRVGSGRSRTHDQMASVPRSQSFALVAYVRSARYGQTTVTTASATHPTSAGRPCTWPWLRCTSAGLRVAPLLRRISSLPRPWAPSSGLPPDRSGGIGLTSQPVLSPRLVWLLSPRPQAGPSRRATQRRRSEARKPFDSGRAWHLPDLTMQAMASRGQEATRTWRA
jgi:hypothetical protein